METKRDIDHFINTIVQEDLYSTKSNLKFHLDTLFKNVSFKSKNVLDIGGGSGLHSFYAAFRGAQKVINLEPGEAGSTSDVTKKFFALKEKLKLNNVELVTLKFQNFIPERKNFDIILLHNSINHLNESACINLLNNSKSRKDYLEIFGKIFTLANRGATLIICDCSRYNFYSHLNIRNPFMPTIEWEKHQAPRVWANLLETVGFVKPKIQWSSFNTLQDLGKIILGNKFMAYFLTSHFRLTMEKP